MILFSWNFKKTLLYRLTYHHNEANSNHSLFDDMLQDILYRWPALSVKYPAALNSRGEFHLWQRNYSFPDLKQINEHT